MNLAQAANGFHGLGEGLADAVDRRTIPFDYAFRFDLTGQPEAVQNKTVTVSIEASFTSVSIGYGVIPKVSPIKFGLLPESIVDGMTDNPELVLDFVNALKSPFDVVLSAITSIVVPRPPAPKAVPRDAICKFAQQSFLRTTIAALAEALDEPLNSANPIIGERTAAALRNGLKFNPDLIGRTLLSLAGGAFDDTSLLETFQAVAAPPGRIQFKYALFDEGSGREFQSEPVLNTAGLGASDGGRPFRYFARPVEFAPRTTIRMQITEVSDFQGELHVSLQGYKTLGGFGTPTSASATRPAHRRMRR